MKKIILLSIALWAGLGLWAQNTTPTEEVVQNVPLTQRGFKILPEAGDYALGIDAAPFFRYVGNAFNGTSNNQQPWFGWDYLTFRGKYFTKANRAYRATLSLNIGNKVEKGTVRDDYAFSQPDYNGQTVIDVKEQSNTNIDLRFGYEYRRGYRRLQGIYGYEAGINFGKVKNTYTYANAITEQNKVPSSYTFFPDNNVVGNMRTLENNFGATFGVYAGGFVGIEYFLASKISIGGEMALGFNAFNKWQDETTTEAWSDGEQKVVQNTTRTLNGQTGDLRLQTLTDGKIFIMFHF